MRKLVVGVLFAFLLVGIVSAVQVCENYDNFNSGSLDSSKWTIKQDIEGQPLMDEGTILNENGFVFHTKQNTPTDRRIYLVPNYAFKSGDVFEYDLNVVSYDGVYGSLVLLTGDLYARLGIVGQNGGPQPFNELGLTHVILNFSQNNLQLTRISPSNQSYIQNIALPIQNGTYGLYVGSFSGSNGVAHIDYDNFKICKDVQVVDSDNDGVNDNIDKCLNTNLPEKFNRLILARYGDIDGDKIFETVKLNKKDKLTVIDSSYALKDTFGCSCKQILKLTHSHSAEQFFGCKKATITKFIRSF
ncbi:MAG: hypothetical protein WC796_01920 [Candidatus Pacearchaeota archaeon]|jgi:hypothetical protein